MFNSRFLKNSSYAVLSASIVSMAQGDGGFAQGELENKENATCNANSKNVLSSSLKQEESKIDDVNSVDEIKDLKQTGLEKDTKEKEENKKKSRRIWPWIVFGIPTVVLGGIFCYLMYLSRFGTKKFKKLGFLERIKKTFDLEVGICTLSIFFPIFKEGGRVFAIKELCGEYFNSDEILRFHGLYSEESMADAEQFEVSVGKTIENLVKTRI